MFSYFLSDWGGPGYVYALISISRRASRSVRDCSRWALHIKREDHCTDFRLSLYATCTVGWSILILFPLAEKKSCIKTRVGP